MKIFIVIIVSVALLFSCRRHQIPIFENAYLGMTIGDYQKVFNYTYTLKSTASKLICSLKPGFTRQHLSSLALCVNDISDYDTAYTVYELGNDFIEKYGYPIENRESVWAGGSSKYFRWKKGLLEITYSYTYNQEPGTRGLLYDGEATIIYKTDIKNL